jgi:hypothetical protein
MSRNRTLSPSSFSRMTPVAGRTPSAALTGAVRLPATAPDDELRERQGRPELALPGRPWLLCPVQRPMEACGPAYCLSSAGTSAAWSRVYA